MDREHLGSFSGSEHHTKRRLEYTIDQVVKYARKYVKLFQKSAYLKIFVNRFCAAEVLPKTNTRMMRTQTPSASLLQHFRI